MKKSLKSRGIVPLNACILKCFNPYMPPKDVFLKGSPVANPSPPTPKLHGIKEGIEAFCECQSSQKYEEFKSH